MVNDADERYQGKRWILGAYGESDNWGLFRCKVVLLEGEKKSSAEEEVIFDVEDSDDTMEQTGNFSELYLLSLLRETMSEYGLIQYKDTKYIRRQSSSLSEERLAFRNGEHLGDI